MPDNTQEVTIAIPESLLSKAVWKLHNDGHGPMTYTAAVSTVLAAYVDNSSSQQAPLRPPPSSDQGTENPFPATDAFDPTTAYHYKTEKRSIYLPRGTLAIMSTRQGERIARIDGPRSAVFKGESMTLGDFVRRASPTRNTTSALKFKRPHDNDFIPAKDLLMTEGVPREKEGDQDKPPPFLYREVLREIQALEELNFPGAMFRKLHHKGDTLGGFKKYVSFGVENSPKDTKCQFNSPNGKIVRRMQYILRNGTKMETTSQWEAIISQALQEVPLAD